VLSGSDQASGVLVQMFPAVHWSWFSETWVISEPPVGDLGDDFFEDEPGYYYFKNSEHPAAVDRAAFDATDPTAAEYAANPTGASMTELMARDLVPIAVLHGAGVMKLYLDEARAAAPVSTDPPDEPPAETGGCSVAGRGADGAALLLLALALVFRRKR
jgi:MYXO-CTERM domain-containing protein